jgi:leucyl-tRNA synthetase
MHKTIKGVSEDIENLKFNTAIAKLMILVNELTALESVSRKDVETLLALITPFAPHVAEEMWEMLGHRDLLVFHPWPQADASKMVDASVEIVVSINGKVRDKLIAPLGASDTWLKEEALKLPRIIEMMAGQPVRKWIIVPNKLINIVL